MVERSTTHEDYSIVHHPLNTVATIYIFPDFVGCQPPICNCHQRRFNAANNDAKSHVGQSPKCMTHSYDGWFFLAGLAFGEINLEAQHHVPSYFAVTIREHSTSQCCFQKWAAPTMELAAFRCGADGAMRGSHCKQFRASGPTIV